MLSLLQQNSATGQTGLRCYEIGQDLKYGSESESVRSLQTYLQVSGYLDSEPTGFYGGMTYEAVKAFQRKNQIEETGYFGSISRNKLKDLTCAEMSQPSFNTSPIKVDTETPKPVKPVVKAEEPITTVSKTIHLEVLNPKTGKVIAPNVASGVYIGEEVDVRLTVSAGAKCTVRTFPDGLTADVTEEIINIKAPTTKAVYKYTESYDLNTETNFHADCIYPDGTNAYAVASVKPEVAEITSFKSTTNNDGSVTITWKTTAPAYVSLTMSCPVSSIEFVTDKGNQPSCEKGGVWSWEHDDSGSITLTPVKVTQLQTVPMTLTIFKPSTNGYSYVNTGRYKMITVEVVPTEGYVVKPDYDELQNLRISSELWYNQNNYSYSNLCSQSFVTNSINSILKSVSYTPSSHGVATHVAQNSFTSLEDRTASCHANDNQYSIVVPMTDGISFWCIDSTGVSRQSKVAVPANAYTCP